jgi:nucleotide-binding universal stress UspA family protein
MALQVLYPQQEPTMLPISRILFPVDLSDWCLAMLPHAKAVATKYDAELILFYAASPLYPIPATGYSGPAYIPVPKEVIDAEGDELEKFGADQLHDIKLQHVLYIGDPVEQIAGFLKSEKIDLIAMPTHGRGEFRRFLIGSVTAKVLHDVDCPVLTGVHMKELPAATFGTYSNVLCAIDLGPQSQDVIKCAAQLAADFHAQLSVVHAVPPPGLGADPLLSLDWRNEVVNVARLSVEKLLGENGAAEAHVYIQEGESAHAVCSLAKKVGADLLVIGRGPQDGAGGHFTTHAYAIIRQSPCPVVSI